MKKAMLVFATLLTISSAGTCRNVTVTDGKGYVHTILVCD